eukprot:6693290-Alexandrium_andersonii.AAC.1
MIASDADRQEVSEWREVVESALADEDWAQIREARSCAPTIRIRNLEFEFPDDMPEAAYMEPEETTQDVEMTKAPEATAAAPDEPAPAG